MSCPAGTEPGIQTAVDQILVNLNIQLTQSLKNQQREITKLTSQKISLSQQSEDMQTAIDTYDREFNQRMENPTEKNVFSTTQDWILAIFFITYGLMVLSLCFTIKFNLFTFVLFLLAILGLSVSVVFMIQKMA